MSTMILIELVFAFIFLVPVTIYAIANLFDYLLPNVTITHGLVWIPRLWTIGFFWHRGDDGALSISINVLPTIQYVFLIEKRE